MPLELNYLQDRLTRTEAEIRWLKSRMNQFGSLGTVRLSQMTGVLPPANGGTGVTCSILGSVSPWTNSSGASAVKGTVVVSLGNRTFNVTTTVGNRRVIGVVSESTILDTESGCIRHGGYQDVVLVQGAVAAGDYLYASATSGRAASAGVAMVSGVFAMALTANGAGAGQVAAMMLGAAHEAAGGGHDAVTLDADAALVLDLQGAGGQEIGLDTQAANSVFAGPTTGAPNEPTFRALVAADMPAGTSHDAVTLDADAATLLDLQGAGGQELGLDTQVANRVFAGPASGANNEPTFRALVAADLPSTSLPDVFAKGGLWGSIHPPATTSGGALTAVAATGMYRNDADATMFSIQGTDTLQEDADGFFVRYRQTTNGANSGFCGAANVGPHSLRQLPQFLIKFGLTYAGTNSPEGRWFICLTSVDLSTQVGGDTPAASYIGIRFSEVGGAGDTQFQFVCDDGGGAPTVVSTGINVDQLTHFLRITVIDATTNVLVELLDANMAVQASTTFTTGSGHQLPATTTFLHPCAAQQNLAASQTNDVRFYYAHGSNKP